MKTMNYPIAYTKAVLLSKEFIKISADSDNYLNIQRGNLYKNEWIFLRLNNKSRVRMTINENAELSLVPLNNNSFKIINESTNEVIIENVCVEPAIVHAPEQLFFMLHKNCHIKCAFCPLASREEDSHYTLERIFNRINDIEINNIKSIGFTSSIPHGLSTCDIVDEMIFNIKNIKETYKIDVPFGVSIKTPSKEDLYKLKINGVNEVRLNLEIFNEKLAKYLMPLKSKNQIFDAIKHACGIFGEWRVSSNILVGIGECDEDILNGVEQLASIGAVATLYPYDTFDSALSSFSRPSPSRLYKLALEHKRIFKNFKVNTDLLQTMCCSCTASHIFPGVDL